MEGRPSPAAARGGGGRAHRGSLDLTDPTNLGGMGLVGLKLAAGETLESLAEIAARSLAGMFIKYFSLYSVYCPV